MVETVGGSSLASRAKSAILDSVLEGRFEDGRLPAEPALASMLGVSRTTVRAALQSLEQDGLLVRTPGRGTTVRPYGVRSLVALQHLIGFERLLETGGHQVTRHVEWRISDLDEDLLESAGLEPGAKCFVFEKLLFCDGEPAIWLRDVFPLEVFAQLPDPGQEIPESTFEISDQMFRDRIDHALVELVPTTTDARVATLLHEPLGTPYLRLEEKHYSDHDSYLGLSEIHVRDRFLRFQVLRRR